MIAKREERQIPVFDNVLDFRGKKRGEPDCTVPIMVYVCPVCSAALEPSALAPTRWLYCPECKDYKIERT